MTAQEFLQYPEVNFHMELIDGVVFYPHLTEDEISRSPTPKHQCVVGNTFMILHSHVRQFGGEVFGVPVDLYLDERHIIQADVMWLSPDTDIVETEKQFRGAPDLAVEILSPSTTRHDTVTKRALYEKHGTREYWIIDPVKFEITVYSADSGAFTLTGTYSKTQTFTSPPLNITVAAADIFKGI